MLKPQRRQLRPQFAEVMRFEGWQNAQAIFDWCGKVFYVGRGHEHGMRRENEFDRGNHHIREEAPPYLVLDTTDEGRVRVDVGDWVVLGGSEGTDLGKMTNEQLQKFYPEVADA